MQEQERPYRRRTRLTKWTRCAQHIVFFDVNNHEQKGAIVSLILVRLVQVYLCLIGDKGKSWHWISLSCNRLALMVLCVPHWTSFVTTKKTYGET